MEALFAGGTKTTVQTATNLRRDTQCRSFPVRNKNSLHEAATFNPNSPLAGAITGVMLTHNFGRCNLSNGLELFSEDLAEIAHLVNIRNAVVVNPLQYLLSSEFFLSKLQKVLFHRGHRQTQQVNLFRLLLGRVYTGGDEVGHGLSS